MNLSLILKSFPGNVAIFLAAPRRVRRPRRARLWLASHSATDCSRRSSMIAKIAATPRHAAVLGRGESKQPRDPVTVQYLPRPRQSPTELLTLFGQSSQDQQEGSGGPGSDAATRAGCSAVTHSGNTTHTHARTLAQTLRFPIKMSWASHQRHPACSSTSTPPRAPPPPHSPRRP